MNLKILLPYRIFAEEYGVSRVVVETSAGSFGLLRHRLDCVAALVPGILVYEIPPSTIAYVAVDQGVLVKNGAAVLISVRRAIAGTVLTELQAAVKRDFLQLDERELQVRAVIAKMEAGLMGRFARFQHGR